MFKWFKSKNKPSPSKDIIEIKINTQIFDKYGNPICVKAMPPEIIVDRV